jgi:hypothetical protein
MRWLPISTWPFSNLMRDLATFHFFAAKSTMRLLMAVAAIFAAMPLRSEPDDAAVGDVLGTLPVVVAVMRTRSAEMPNTSATTCAILI